MKKLLFAVLILFCSSSLALAQKTFNDLNVEKRDISPFHGIEVGTGVELVLTEGNVEEIAVSASTLEFRDKLITKVEKGILKIHYKTEVGSINRKQDKNLKAYVSYKTLDLLHVTTGAEARIEGVLKSSSLDITVNTGGELKGEVNIGTLGVKQNTGSRVVLSGKAEKLDVEGDTGSEFKGEHLLTSSCVANASTGASVSVKAEKELQAKANSGGSIRYKGNATNIDIKTHTGGSVTKI